MRKEGTIVRWDDAKGFGFIRSGSVAQDVFLHARDYRSNGGDAPRPGLRVTFEAIHVGGKGPRAMDVQPIGASRAGTGFDGGRRPGAARAPVLQRQQRARRRARAPHSGSWLAFPLMVAYAIALVCLVWRGQVPSWVLPASLLLHVATFFAYWQDKYAAQQGRWRVKEDTLHLLSLAGGWAGAWFAHQVLRHKSVKERFRSAYWTTVVVHCAGVFGICWFARGF